MSPVFVITASDIAGAIVVCFVLLIILLSGLSEFMRQRKCKHDGRINETQACDAICAKCGKNLGFIGSLRNRGKP